MSSEHPSWLGLFVLRRDGDGPVTCDHCGDLWPCDVALSLHDCKASPLCWPAECGFRREWQHNRPEMARGAGTGAVTP